MSDSFDSSRIFAFEYSSSHFLFTQFFSNLSSYLPTLDFDLFAKQVQQLFYYGIGRAAKK